MTDGSSITTGETPNMGPDPESLVALLADSTARTTKAVRRALLGLGDTARGALISACNGPDAQLRARARQVLLDIDQAGALGRLRDFVGQEDGDLLTGLTLVDEVLGDGVNPPQARRAVDGLLDEWSEAVRRACGGSAVGVAPLAVAHALRDVLADHAGFCGADDEFHHQTNVSLARTIAGREGLPLTLCAIYALVARRAGCEAGLLPFPGQVLLAIGPGPKRLIMDPFLGGQILSDADCKVRLDAYGAPPTPLWFEPSQDRQMVLRQLRNLGAAMKWHGRPALARTIISIADEMPWDL